MPWVKGISGSRSHELGYLRGSCEATNKAVQAADGHACAGWPSQLLGLVGRLGIDQDVRQTFDRAGIASHCSTGYQRLVAKQIAQGHRHELIAQRPRGVRRTWCPADFCTLRRRAKLIAVQEWRQYSARGVSTRLAPPNQEGFKGTTV